jgi:ferredoxin
VKVVVEQKLCAGHGECEVVAPRLFVIDDDGMARFIWADSDGPVPEGPLAEAVRRCPAGAIVIEQD